MSQILIVAELMQSKQSKLTICTAIYGEKIISIVKKTSAHLFFVGLDVEHVPVEQNQLFKNWVWPVVNLL